MVDKNGNKIEVKKDCIFFRNKQKSEGSCLALRALYCTKENCKFYKTKDNSK